MSGIRVNDLPWDNIEAHIRHTFMQQYGVELDFLEPLETKVYRGINVVLVDTYYQGKRKRITVALPPNGHGPIEADPNSGSDWTILPK